MRIFSQFVSVFCALFVSAQAGAAQFEGVIHMTMQGSADERAIMEQVWYAKGDRARMESSLPTGGSHYFILDRKRNVMMMPNDEEKTYIEWGLDEPDQMVADEQDDYVIERTGKTDRVAGYTCEIIHVKRKGTKNVQSESCIGKGLGTFMMGRDDRSRRGAGSTPAWMKDMIKEGGFPLRTIVRSEDGAEEMRMQVTKIEKKRLNDSLFIPPAGFKKLDMKALMQGLGQPGVSGFGGRKPEGAAGGVDLEKMMRDAQQRRTQQGGRAAGQKSGEPPPDMSEVLKNIEEMMKKREGGK